MKHFEEEVIEEKVTGDLKEEIEKLLLQQHPK